jgi:hypothetical protein
LRNGTIIFPITTTTARSLRVTKGSGTKKSLNTID